MTPVARLAATECGLFELLRAHRASPELVEDVERRRPLDPAGVVGELFGE